MLDKKLNQKVSTTLALGLWPMWGQIRKRANNKPQGMARRKGENDSLNKGTKCESLRLFQKLLRCASYFESLDHQRVVSIFTNWFEQVNYVQIEFFKF